MNSRIPIPVLYRIYILIHIIFNIIMDIIMVIWTSFLFFFWRARTIFNHLVDGGVCSQYCYLSTQRTHVKLNIILYSVCVNVMYNISVFVRAFVMCVRERAHAFSRFCCAYIYIYTVPIPLYNLCIILYIYIRLNTQ